MPADRNAPPTLADMFRQIDGRLRRVVVYFEGRNGNVEPLRAQVEKLDAWGELVGIRRNILETVEEDGGELCTSTRSTFYELNAAIERLEWQVGMRRAPNNVSASPHNALKDFEWLLDKKLTFDTGKFTEFERRLSANAATPASSSHSSPRPLPSAQRRSAHEHMLMHILASPRPSDAPELPYSSHSSPANSHYPSPSIPPRSPPTTAPMGPLTPMSGHFLDHQLTPIRNSHTEEQRRTPHERWEATVVLSEGSEGSPYAAPRPVEPPAQGFSPRPPDSQASLPSLQWLAQYSSRLSSSSNSP